MLHALLSSWDANTICVLEVALYTRGWVSLRRVIRAANTETSMPPALLMCHDRSIFLIAHTASTPSFPSCGDEQHVVASHKRVPVIPS